MMHFPEPPRLASSPGERPGVLFLVVQKDLFLSALSYHQRGCEADGCAELRACLLMAASPHHPSTFLSATVAAVYPDVGLQMLKQSPGGWGALLPRHSDSRDLETPHCPPAVSLSPHALGHNSLRVLFPTKV